ncbi:MAG: hypothetical protein H5T86_12620, partial [Armatimonadetes bacterium]|nr:hypothetical protein [Armatimonadota bacterium]
LALTADQAAAGLSLVLGDVSIRWSVRGDGVVGAGAYICPARKLLTLAARQDGTIRARGSSTLTWRLEFTRLAAAAGKGQLTDTVVVQEDHFNLFGEGTHSRVNFDPSAVNGFAAWMGGHHHEWAVQWHMQGALFKPGTEYDVFARVKVSPAEGKTGPAFSAGVYDTVNRRGLASITVNLDQVTPGQWQLWHVGRVSPADGQYVWLAPPTSVGNIQAMWVDYVLMRPAGGQ